MRRKSPREGWGEEKSTPCNSLPSLVALPKAMKAVSIGKDRIPPIEPFSADETVEGSTSRDPKGGTKIG
jgi:hypothetical protein